MKALYISLFLICASVSLALQAQEVIESRRFREYSLENGPYPFAVFDYDQARYAATHPVAERLGEDRFLYLFQPRFSSFRDRELACYDLNLEKVWSTEFRMKSSELVFHFYTDDSLAYVLSGNYVNQANAHEIRLRSYALSDGSETRDQSLMIIPGPQRLAVGYAVSPDTAYTLIYFLEDNSRDNARYIFNNGLPGVRINRAENLRFSLFDQQMNLADSGRIALDLERRDGAQFIDATVDDEGNVFATVYEDDEQLEVIGWLRQQGKQVVLRYQGFPEPWDRHAPYMTYLPPKAGLPGRIHVAHAIRDRNRGRWETRAFKLVTFDFKRGTVRDSFQANISASLLVEVGKARESVNLKPQTVFDRYLILDLLPLADGRVWMLAQRHELSSQNRIRGGQIIGRDYSIKNEELLLIGFAVSGKPEGVLIMPIRQFALQERAAFSMAHRYQLNRETGALRLVTWEASGERRRSPERLYYREIDLKAGQTSPRRLLYDGRRRDQYYLAPYTLWLNPFIMSTLIIEGNTDRYPRLTLMRIPGGE